MKKVAELSYNELRTEAKRLGIVLKNGKKEEYISLIEAKNKEVDSKKDKKKKDVPVMVELGTLAKGQHFMLKSGNFLYKVMDLLGPESDKVLIAGVNGSKSWKEKKSYKVIVP